MHSLSATQSTQLFQTKQAMTQKGPLRAVPLSKALAPASKTPQAVAKIMGKTPEGAPAAKPEATIEKLISYIRTVDGNVVRTFDTASIVAKSAMQGKNGTTEQLNYTLQLLHALVIKKHEASYPLALSAVKAVATNKVRHAGLDSQALAILHELVPLDYKESRIYALQLADAALTNKAADADVCTNAISVVEELVLIGEPASYALATKILPLVVPHKKDLAVVHNMLGLLGHMIKKKQTPVYPLALEAATEALGDKRHKEKSWAGTLTVLELLVKEQYAPSYLPAQKLATAIKADASAIPGLKAIAVELLNALPKAAAT